MQHLLRCILSSHFCPRLSLKSLLFQNQIKESTSVMRIFQAVSNINIFNLEKVQTAARESENVTLNSGDFETSWFKPVINVDMAKNGSNTENQQRNTCRQTTWIQWISPQLWNCSVVQYSEVWSSVCRSFLAAGVECLKAFFPSPVWIWEQQISKWQVRTNKKKKNIFIEQHKVSNCAERFIMLLYS